MDQLEAKVDRQVDLLDANVKTAIDVIFFALGACLINVADWHLMFYALGFGLVIVVWRIILLSLAVRKHNKSLA